MDLFFSYIKNFKTENKYEMQHNLGLKIINFCALNYYNIANPQIITINKKPEFKHSEIKFSISHSNNITAVCFDINPVGFDIEKIREVNYKKISKRMKFKHEAKTSEEFFESWTLYEANYKLQNVRKSEYTFKFKDEYIISVVSSETTDIKKNLKIYELNIV